MLLTPNIFRFFICLISFAFLFTGCEGTSSQQSRSQKDSISEQLYLDLGGEQQYVEIRGASTEMPVLLFLHGGPGWPQTPHLRYFNSQLRDSLLLVSWDQRGCGKSFIKNPAPENLNKEQLIRDANQLTQYLKKRFKKNKIHLAGFSWGSVIGLELVKRFPKDYETYFSISQVINIDESIRLSTNWLREESVRRNDSAMLRSVNRLEARDTSFCKTTLDCFLKKYEMLVSYGGAIYNRDVEKKISLAETVYEDYRDYDWIGGFLYSCNQLGEEVFTTDLSNIKKVEAPVIFFVGRHDHSLPPSVTERFAASLKTPFKEIVWFESSGHEPLEEEAEKFNREILLRIK